MGRGLVPYLCCADAAAAIDFYTATFGAVEVERWTAADGRIGHAELTLTGGPLFLADEHPEIGVRGPRALGGTAVSFVLSVPDVDATVTRAVEAGATVERPVTAQDDGARSGWIVDPFGHRWNVRTAVEQVSAEQLRDRVGDRYVITDQISAPPGEDPSGELLLVAVVQMASGQTAAGQRSEDAVLGLLDRHGGTLERRMRSTDLSTEAHVIRFRSRAGYESFMADPDRLDQREKTGDAAPSTRVLEVYDL